MAGIDPRYECLLETGLTLAAELSLPAALQRIVELAAELTRARYGALGVLRRDGTISEFITTGVTEEQRAVIGHIPVGRGILGGADRQRRAPAAARHRRRPPLGRVPTQSPANALLPRRSSHRAWPGLRQPVSDREGGWGGLRRRRRAGSCPARRPGWGGHRERPAVRGGP